jgi:hypothetical protein
MWHEAQGVGTGDACVPINANPVVAWSKIAVVQEIVLWQVEQLAAAKALPAAG